MAKPLALIIGVGGATGKAVCERLAGDYRLCMLARSADVIESLAETLPEAYAYRCDVTDAENYAALLRRIVTEHGQPTCVLVNTEGGGWGEYNEIDIERFTDSFSVNVVSLLVMVQTLFPDKQAISTPCRIVISSSPAAYESFPFYLGLAPSRSGQRVLAETLHVVLAERGVTFSLLSIAGAIDEPKMRAAYPDRPDDFFIQPAVIARRVRVLFEGDVEMRSLIHAGTPPDR